MKFTRTTFVRNKNKWGVKVTLVSALMTGILFNNFDQTYAATETINSPQEIAARLNSSDNYLVMAEGDTIWNLGLALGINNPMQLLYDNQYTDGDQYTFPVGTKIHFDGDFLEVINLDGELVGALALQDETLPEKEIVQEEEEEVFVATDNEVINTEDNSLVEDLNHSVPETIIPETEVPEEVIPDTTNPETSVPDTEQEEQTPKPPVSGNETTGVAASVFGQLLAKERAAQGLPPINYSFAIQAATSVRSQELTVNYSHERPSGELLGLLLEQSGAPTNSYGECIAMLGTSGLSEEEIAAIAFENWMKSPGHNAILTSSSYTDYAFSYVDDGANTFATYIAAS